MKAKFIFTILITIVIIFCIYVFLTVFTPLGEYLCNKHEEVKYMREIKKNPSNIDTYNKLTILYWKQNDYSKLLECYRKQLSIDTTKQAELYAQIANMFLIVGSSNGEPSYKDSALKYIREAQKIRSNDPFILDAIANVYAQLEEDSLALYLYKKALAQFHGDSLMLDSKLFKQELLKKIENLKKDEK